MTKVVESDELREWIDKNEYEEAGPPPPPPPQPHRFSLIWPTTEPKVVTQWYGINPQWYNRLGLPGHEGLDFRALTNRPVFAAAEGDVIRVETNPDSGPYGIHVRIQHDHPTGIFKTVYAHFRRAIVAVGNHVMAGSQIGLADNTGNSSGAHLHITLKRVGAGSPWMNTGDIINPVPYMPDLFPECVIPGYGLVGWVLDVKANFRREPKVGNNLIRLITAGSTVKVLDVNREDGGDWWKIVFEDVEGWIWNPGFKLRAL